MGRHKAINKRASTRKRPLQSTGSRLASIPESQSRDYALPQPTWETKASHRATKVDTAKSPHQANVVDSNAKGNQISEDKSMGQPLEAKSKTSTMTDLMASMSLTEQKPTVGQEGIRGNLSARRVAELRELEALRKENTRLKIGVICRICRDRNTEIQFLPCGHVCTCSYCCSAVTECYVCKGRIRGLVGIYWG